MSKPTAKKNAEKALHKPTPFSRFIIGAILVACGIAGVLIWALSPSEGTPTDQKTAKTIQPGYADTPVIALDENARYYAHITIDGYGTVTVLLDQKAAPITVSNFIDLAEQHFYDGLTFHRIMKGFMMQGGDPSGNGSGGSDRKIKGEFAAGGTPNPLSHTRGTVSMARATALNSASSQFFIVQEDSTFLDGRYAAFGRVTAGLDIVDEICNNARPTDNNGTIQAAEQPVITSVTVETQ